MTRPGPGYTPREDGYRDYDEYKGRRADDDRAAMPPVPGAPGQGSPYPMSPGADHPHDGGPLGGVAAPAEATPWGMPAGYDASGQGAPAGVVAGAAGPPADLGGHADAGYTRPPWETSVGTEATTTQLAGLHGDHASYRSGQVVDQVVDQVAAPPVPPAAVPRPPVGDAPAPPPAHSPAPVPAAPAGAQPEAAPNPIEQALAGTAAPPPTAGPDPDTPGVEVSVDGTVVADGTRAVTVNLAADGSAQVTPADPAAPAAPPAPAGQSGQSGQSERPERPEQPAVPGQPPADPADPAEPPARAHVDGIGDNAATVDLAVAPDLADAGLRAVRNADGSVDLVVPKGPATGGHEMNVHVPPGRDVDVEVTRGADGLVDLRVAPGSGGPDQQPGAPAAGQPPGADGADPPGTPQTPTTPEQPEQPEQPEAPAGGGPPPGGGGPPPGGGGGPPPGGAPPGASPPGAGPPPNGGQRNGGDGDVKADPTKIRQLGRDLTDTAGPILDRAGQKASAVDVGFPAFGVLGFPLNLAHNQVRDYAAQYIGQGRNQLYNWRQALHGMATNWENAEQASTVQEQ